MRRSLANDYTDVHSVSKKLDNTARQVWGAYDSPPDNKPGNSNALAKYGLSLDIIARFSYRVQQDSGIWYQITAQQTAASVLANTNDLTLDKMVSWNVAVCEIAAALAGQYFSDDFNIPALHAGVSTSFPMSYWVEFS